MLANWFSTVPPYSTACLSARPDEPQPCVDATGDVCKEISCVGVLKESRLLTGIAYMFAKGGKLRRKCIDVALPLGGCQHILIERRSPGDRVRCSLSHAPKLHNVLGDPVRILLHSLGDLVKQLAQGYAMRPFDVPVALPAL